MRKIWTSLMVMAFLMGSLPSNNFADSRKPGSSGSSSGSKSTPSQRPSSPPKSAPSQRPSSPPPAQKSTPPANSTPSQRPNAAPAKEAPKPSVRPGSTDSKKDSTPATPPPAATPPSASVRPNQQQNDTNKSAPSVRPGSASPAPPQTAGNSVKPTNNTYNGAAVASKKSDESKTQFVKANAPKSDFKTPTGQTVKIDPNSESTKRVRNLPSEQVDPVRRREVVEKHYYHYYGNRYDYYRSQPPIYVGYYRPEFWWSTYDWDTHRQAVWLYNNQSLISSDLWNQRMQNAALRAEIDRMRMQQVRQDANYVDPEFASEPVAMYSDQYVDAAFNGQSVAVAGSGGVFKWLCISIVSIGLIALAVYLVFIHQWTKN